MRVPDKRFEENREYRLFPNLGLFNSIPFKNFFLLPFGELPRNITFDDLQSYSCRKPSVQSRLQKTGDFLRVVAFSLFKYLIILKHDSYCKIENEEGADDYARYEV